MMLAELQILLCSEAALQMPPNMWGNGLTVERCYLELIDLKQNEVIAHGGRSDEKPSNCIESELLTLDLFKTIAVKVYAEISQMSYMSEHFVIASNRP